MTKTHTLKCWDVYYDAVASGAKTFEVRRDDRGFQRGDVLILQRCTKEWPRSTYEVEWDVSTDKPKYELQRCIGWILTGGQFGIMPGFVVFSLEELGKVEGR